MIAAGVIGPRGAQAARPTEGGSPAAPPAAGAPVSRAWVVRVYFHDVLERDKLARELDADEVATTGGYLTVIADRDMYAHIQALGVRYSIDEEGTKQINNPVL